QESLCWRCANATGADCAFFWERDAQTGLQAVQAKALTLETEEGVFFRVTSCPSFREGPPPPMKAQALLALTML
ncbi:MAG: hypothetical protein K6U04_10825, partial [Armatimonadetes bacterium]|nr:hypothetical protein [Armatimonadota bacterium]